MLNLDKALAWAKLGQKVLPCRHEDAWVGARLLKAKSPLVDHGVDDASCDEIQIRKWFSELYPDALVGVKAGDRLNVADVDIDMEKGIDGAFELSELRLELPDTFSYQTKRGGWHYIYRAEPGEKLGPLAPVLDEENKPIKGVDRRAGNSYFIPWGDEIPENLASLASAPAWLSRPASTSELSEYSKGLRVWLDEIPSGFPTAEVLKAANSIPDGSFGHSQMISLQRRMVGLAAAGHTGVGNALVDLQHAWLSGQYDTPQYRRDWIQSLEGAVAKFGALNIDNSVPDEHEAEVQRIIRRRKAEQEAERRLLDADSANTEVMTWEDLANAHRDYIVDSLVPSDGLVFIVARSNLGKTLAYVDMLCRCTFGMTWLGKKTRKVKAMVVVSEGKSGFLPRFESWCDYHDKDLSEVQKMIVPVTGANLNSTASLNRLSKIALEHGVELIIFDTYSNTSGLSDEDAAGPAAITIRNAVQIKPGSAVLFIHHPRKSDEKTKHPEARGSGAPKGAADVVMTMFFDNDQSLPSGTKWISLSTESLHAGKNRDAKTETIRGLRLDKSRTSTPVMVWSREGLVPEPVRKVESVLEGDMTLREIAESLSVSAKTADRYLIRGIELGRIERVESSAANRPHLYRLRRA